MEWVLDQAKQFANETDSVGRRKLALALRDFSYSLETPKDTIVRIASYPLRATAVRTGIDLNLFGLLVASEIPLDVETLAERTSADATLVGRYLRYLASYGIITETAKDTFTANGVTKVLDDPAKQAEIIHFFDTVSPTYLAMPAFLRSSKFADPISVTNCPFQLAYKTSKSAFEYFPELPVASQDAFNKHMSTRTINMKSWLSVFPFADETADCDSNDVVFVDVGGGIGHQCKELRERYPDLKGRVIVQDLEHAISRRLEYPGVEGIVHDFFAKQPIEGARFYYLRAVLHDWPDSCCRTILSNLKNAMGSRSRILIEEMVLPDMGVDWTATHNDLTMMASLGARERTQGQWESLLDSAGLKIEVQRHYEGGWGGYEAVMTVAQK